jgi:hypothetical protein
MAKDEYFSVKPYPESGSPNDIYFGVCDNAEDFPDHIIDLKSDFEQFISVIKTVFKNDSSLFDGYYNRVFSLADLAFNSPRDQSVIAQKSLDKLKNEVVVDVGPLIRSQLLFNFVKCAFLPFIISILIVFLGDKFLSFIYGLVGTPEGFYFLGNLGLVAIGSMVGGWLSIATATRTISYPDIIPILNNHKGILVRILFIVTLGVSLAILMISGILTINLGGLNSDLITSNSSVALSFGFIIGFADKIFVEKFEAKLIKAKL